MSAIGGWLNERGLVSLSQLKAPAAPDDPCPDCAASYVNNRLLHESGCPIGEGVEAASDDDRRFFENHPDQTVRTRRMTAAERKQFGHTDSRYLHPLFKDGGYVQVTSWGPGLRVREPFAIHEQ